MDELTGRKQLVETGRELLEKGLVARTWGNVSCRLDAERFLITPSGLDYTRTGEDDIVIYDRVNGTWDGKRKPSSEKGVHAAAYELFPDVNFVIHTHQTYATALGLVGWDSMDVTAEERDRLGGTARAEYGLPGQKKLRENVRAAMASGAKTVFMVNHGVVICGESKEDAMEKAALLEELCRRNCKGSSAQAAMLSPEETQKIMNSVNAIFPEARLVQTDALLIQAEKKRAIRAQLDDMAQMIGSKITVVPANPKKIVRKLKKHNAVLVTGLGCAVRGRDADDTEALGLLADKAAVSALHCLENKVRVRLSGFDVALMNLVYNMKYSKKKGE